VTPIWDNINFNNITIDASPQVLNLTGVASNPTNMTLSNSTFTNVKKPTNTISSAKVTFSAVTINGTPQ
jgi:hypothetical protein